jgi:hypothetical protein
MFTFSTGYEDDCKVIGCESGVLINDKFKTLAITYKQAITLERQLATLNHARRDYERTQRAASLGVTVPQMIESDRADAETVRMLTAELEATS